MAAASIKRAGKVSDIEARAIVTLPSSSGWRITSSTLRRKLRQLVQKENAVVRARLRRAAEWIPPPISPASEIVWCGARNGACLPVRTTASSTPATLWILYLQRFFQRRRRQNAGKTLGQHGLAEAGRPDHQKSWPPALQPPARAWP